MTNCNSIVNNNFQKALQSEYERLGLYSQPSGASSGETYGDMMFEYSKAGGTTYSKNLTYPTKKVDNKDVAIIPQRQNAAIVHYATMVSSDECKTPCKPNRIGAGKYYGSASNCKNDGTQGSCYMYSYPNPQTSTDPNAPVGPNTRRFARNFIPTKANAYGLRLLFNNNKFSLTNSATGRVGTTAGASRAINRGRASARNAAKVSYNNRK